VTLHNSGAFTAGIFISYFSEDAWVSFDTGDFPQGESNTFDIPPAKGGVLLDFYINLGAGKHRWVGVEETVADFDACYVMSGTMDSPAVEKCAQ
jgi:hypothetical protein